MQSSNKRLRNIVIQGGVLGVLLGLVFIAGFLFHKLIDEEPVQAQSSNTAQPALEQSDPFTDANFMVLDEVHGLVRDNFYRELPDATALEYAAIRGYLGALSDPYSFFSDPPVAQSESDALAGRYGGIGVDIKRSVAGLVELYPYPDSPAVQAGVLEGDILISINGELVASDERVDVIRQMLRGEVTEEGNGVEITVRRPDADEERVYQIAFAEIQVPSMVWRMLPGEPALGYVHISAFTARTPEELALAIADLRDRGMAGLVLDLRDNAGGLLQESVDVAAEFLDGGIVAIEQSRVTETIEEDTPGGFATDMPLIVVVNSRTASAAEVVAGAIQQNDRAILVGQRTRGKGSVQFIFGLSDGSSLRITAAIWLTPDRTPLDGVGLVPDIEMIPDETGRDVELDEAARQLRQRIVESN